MAAMPMLAAELVNLQPRVIVTGVTSGVVAIRRLTSTIQIVGSGLVDPVGLGLADSYARPGKSVTGLLLLVEGYTPNKWSWHRN
jgi:putative tryptophan/tyrosine transport system substrate-binding protein